MMWNEQFGGPTAGARVFLCGVATEPALDA